MISRLDAFLMVVYTSDMAKKLVIGLVLFLALGIGPTQIQNQLIGNNKEGLYAIGKCYRDDEFGVTYRVDRTVKGNTFATILESAKYPTQYPVKDERHWPSDENPQKLYPVNCPN